jgi:hypothetical protein
MSDKTPPIAAFDPLPSRLAEIAWHALMVKGMSPHQAAASAVMYAEKFAEILASHGKTEKADP